MKQVGDWYIPDYDNPEKLTMISSGTFQCEEVLLRSFSYVTDFNTAIDVGSWIGDSSVILSRKFKNLKIFEPVPQVAECCRKNLEDRNIENFELFEIGLSNKKAKQVLVNKGKSFSGWISTVDESDLRIKRSTLVETDILDNFQFSNIDLIKIDVDSHEGFLLEGSKNFFKNNNPVVVIESKPKDQLKYQQKSMPDPIVFLKKIGYKTRELVGKADYILTR
jgi:FkbM family methyltransferase